MMIRKPMITAIINSFSHPCVVVDVLADVVVDMSSGAEFIIVVAAPTIGLNS